MKIESRSHLNLVSRSLNRGWLDGFDDRRQQEVESILAVIENTQKRKFGGIEFGEVK